jgi:HTH-type transcriptional regulator / antitoxin HigA
MSKSSIPFNPDYAVPPGATLLDTIEDLGMTQTELARRMGRPLKTVNEIINGKAEITAETSIQLERVTGIPAAFWNNAEATFRERKARLHEQARLAAQTRWLSRFSYPAMLRHRLIAPVPDDRARVGSLLSFFGVASSDQWETTYSRLEGAARESGRRPSDLGDLSAWLRAGEILAQRCRTTPYDKARFQAALAEIRALTADDPVRIWTRVRHACAEAGVAVVRVPELPKTHASGFTRWLTPQKALIQLSLRYKTDDVLWFTFFHEAAHLLLHGKNDVFMEFRGADSAEEAEANAWAADFLIPKKAWTAFVQSLPRPVAEADIRRFARDQGIAPGIVLGRLQHHGGLVPKSQFNTALKRSLSVAWEGLIPAAA